MDIVSPQEASPSWASRCAFDVFLSFRGEDTRTKFTGHLYTALIAAGFRTFRDNKGIERGENIKLEIQRAIQRSRISLVVLSENYASSGWCLDELVLILECKRTSGHVVLPLFYDVDPSHVRKQIRGFAEAFKVHEDKYNAETDAKKGAWKEKLEGWRTALREVADLGGMVLQSEAYVHESEFIQKVVKVVQDKLSRTALSVAPYLIGVEDSLRRINAWLHDELITKVGILVIYGMGGIGKTTIAKCLYNLNFERFEGSSFLANVREYSEQSDGLVRLQRQLLSDILRGRKEKISNVDEGIIKIRNALCSKRVLLVVDDVDQRDQLDAILGVQDWFYPGSKVILTTRHERLLKAHEVYEVHEVEKLKYYESLELFSWHAFGQNNPIDCFMDQSKRVVNYCGGLPLALQVLGSSLSGTSVDIWESAIQKLETIPDSQILKKLKISYDGLQDIHDKNLFLDIACFFVGADKDDVITILDSCDYYTKIGLQNLIDRCLLTINQDNKMTMHQLLQQMGREIIRLESPQELEKRTRLCHRKDCIKVLRGKTGTETIEGVSLGLFVSKEKNQAKTSNNGKRDRSSLGNERNSSKRLNLGYFSWLSAGLFSSPPAESFYLSDEVVDFETDAFARMRKLRLLQLKNVQLGGDYKYFPQELRWLCWHGFYLESLPDGFPMENLVCLDIQHSKLKQVWKGRKLLGLLKILDLSYSPFLESTPDFSGLMNLERLSLRYCTKLVEIHESIGELSMLLSLDLEGCKSLRKLPTNVGQLKSVEKLVLSGCSKLNDFPFDLEKMEYLTVFHADGTSICQPHSRNGETKSLASVFRPWISKKEKASKPLRFSFSLSSFCSSLANLSLANCGLTDDDFPKDLVCLSSLRSLNLKGNEISSLPEGIKNLTKLQELELEGCKRLKSLPHLPSSITHLNLRSCKSLEVVTNFPNAQSSLNLLMYNCDMFDEASGSFKLVPILDIDAEVINHLWSLNMDLTGIDEVELGNRMSIISRKVYLQVLREFGIHSIYFPRSEVPAWFSYKSKGSSLSFNVPSVLGNTKIVGLNICTIYPWFGETFNSSRFFSWKRFSITVRNNTKNLTWMYRPTFIGVCDDDDDGKDMTWLCNWKFGNNIESGDSVNISVCLWNDMYVKQLGVNVVYNQEEYPDPSSCQSISGGADLYAYEVGPGDENQAEEDPNPFMKLFVEPIEAPSGPMTRVRARKFKQALSAMVEVTIEQASQLRSVGCESGEELCLNVIGIDLEMFGPVEKNDASNRHN